MRALGVSILFLGAVSAWAGGPLRVNGEGEPMAWAAGVPIHYRPDQGPLGQLDNAEARALLAEAFDVWAAVGVVSFVEDPPLPVDVNVVNFLQYVFCSTGEPCRTDGLSPIVFDADGSIIDAALGSGARFQVFGLGGVQSDTATDPTITEGAMILNGAFFDGFGPPGSPEDLSPTAFKAVLVHEIGHYLNLDHSALNGDLAGDGDPDNDVFLPTMYPFSSDDDTALATLNPDDEAALRGLYDVGPLTGIHGRVQVESPELTGTLHFQGASVVLRRTSDPLMTAYATVSGALFLPCEPGGACHPCSIFATCTANPAARGEFGVDFIEPGNYTVCVEQLDTRLPVGPLDLDGDGVIDGPRPIVPGPEECHDAAESPLAAADDPDDATPVDAESMTPVVVRLNDLPLVDPFEATDTAATPPVLLDLSSGQETVGAVLGPGDVDLYAIALLEGDRLRVDVEAREVGYLQGSTLDAVVGLYDPNDDPLVLGADPFVDDQADPDSAQVSLDPAFELEVPPGSAGTFTLAISSSSDLDFDGIGGNTSGPYWLRVGVDRDSDGDGVVDRLDRCPLDAADDADDDGICGEVDTCAGDSDPDGDGVQGPCIVEAGWRLARVIEFPDPVSARHNVLDGKIYVGRRSGASRGLYRIESDGSAVALWTGDDIAAVLVDPDDGDVFASDDLSREIYRTPFGGTGRSLWVSGFGGPGNDPLGMAIAPVRIGGDKEPVLIEAGEALVAAPGVSNDEVWKWQPALSESEELFNSDAGGVDVDIDNASIWLVDPAGTSPGVILSVGTQGLGFFGTSQPIQEPTAIAIDPRGGDVLVLDIAANGGGRRLLRVHRVTGQVTPLITHFDLSAAEERAGLDIAEHGSILLVTDRAAGRIYVFDRDRDGDGVGDDEDICLGDADPLQADSDADGLGDACDVCPLTFDPEQRVRLDGPNEIVSYAISPDSSRLLYISDQDTANVFELYSMPIAGGTSVKLSGPLVSGGGVHFIAGIAPDSSRVIYQADQDTDGVGELYSVPIAGGATVKLSGPLVSGGAIFGPVLISPDGSRVVYRADQGTDELFELYSVPIGGGAVVKLNGTLVSTGDVDNVYSIAPDSSRVVYRADQITNEVFELFSVPLAGGAAVKLNGTLPFAGDVFGSTISPDSSRVVYMANQNNNNVSEIFSVPLAGGTAVQLNANLATSRDVLTYLIAPDSSRVVYLADQDTEDVYELYSVPLADGATVKLNGGTSTGVNSIFVIAPDSSRVVYISAQDAPGVSELYSAPLAGGATVKLNGPLVSGGNVHYPFDPFFVAPDSSRVVYQADQDTDEVIELYSVPLAGGVPVKLNPALPPGGGTIDKRMTPDGSRVIYTAYLDASYILELYSVPLAGGTAVKLNGALAPGGTNLDQTYTIAPDSSRVIYRADEQADSLDRELYSVELHGDRDADAVADSCDRCPAVADPGQADLDGDGIGDACDICPSAEQQVELGDGHSWDLGGAPPEFPNSAVSPDGTGVVFVAAQGGTHELFRVPAAGGAPIQLSAPLVPGGDVVAFRIAPNSSRVVYVADQDVDNVFELYSVPILGGPAVQLNPALVSFGDVSGSASAFLFSADSTRVVYLADQDVDEVIELYSVPVAGGAAVKLNGALVAGGDVQAQLIFSNSLNVVYVADQDTDEVFELYSVPIAGGTVLKLNGTLAPGGDVSLAPMPATAGTTNRVFYVADQTTDGVFEIFSAAITGGGAVKLNGALVAGGDVVSYGVSRSGPGQRVVYLADQNVDEVYELYSVNISGGGATLLNNTPVAGGDVVSFSISLNNVRVVYQADQNVDEVYELYSVSLLGGVEVVLNGALAPGGDVHGHLIAPDSSRVAYLADQDTDGVDELYGVPLTGGASIKLNDPLAPGGDVRSDFVITPDSSRVIYPAQQDTEGFELYSVPLAGGPPLRISGASAPGGGLWTFALAGDGSRVIYFAFEAAEPVLGLFGATVPDDLDADSIARSCDVCPDTADVDQADGDDDGFGDACDVCPDAFNPGQRAKLNGALAAGGDVVLSDILANDSRVFYRADQEADGVVELYSVPAAGGTSIQLNGSLVPGGNVTNHLISPNGSRVVYLADQETSGVDELYSVPSLGGSPVKLSGALVSGGDVSSTFAISPDSSRVIYLADQDVDNVFDLYSVPLAGGPAVKLNGAVVSGGDVSSAFAISPDSSRVIYLADQDVDNVFDLYSVPFAGGPVVKLNGPLVSGGDVSNTFAVSPDGSRVIYLADQEVDTVVELYSVPLVAGPPVKLSGTLVTGGSVLPVLSISPDSSRVVYVADQEMDTVNELYSVPLAGGPALKLNAPPASGGDVTAMVISPDSSRVVYRADQDTNDVFELYSVPLAGGSPVKLNPPPVPGGIVSSFPILLSPDGSGVVYLGDLDTNDVFELYSVPLVGGATVKLNGPLVSGGDVSSDVRISSDSSRVVYVADQDTDTLNELYSVPLAGGAASKVSGLMPAGRNVTAFAITPDASRAIYRADEILNEVFELFSVELHDDADADGIAGPCDVCPDVADPGQGDADSDGVGDACDNCPVVPNPTQAPCPPDAIGPHVIGVLPRHGVLDVALSAWVEVCLSEVVDPATATTGSFFVEEDGVKLLGSVTVGGSGACLRFDPEGRFGGDTDYTVRVTHELRDLAGLAAFPFASEFDTVGDTGEGALPVGTVGLGGPTGLAGAQFSGRHPGDHAGFSIAALGDVNGGGAADLLSGAPFAGPGGLAGAGSAMLVFGETTLQSNAAATSLRTLEYLGDEADQAAGWSVARAGDLNGDQKADLLIGAPFADANGDASGRVYVVFGHAGLDELAGGALELSELADCSTPTLCGVVFEGAQAGDMAGAAISFAGDLNGDQKDDLLIGAPGASPPGDRTGAGKVYLIYGPLDVPPFTSGLPIDLVTVGSMTPGLVFHGEEAGDNLGAALSAWIDTGVRGSDGKDDFLVGAPGARLFDPWGGAIAGAGIVYAVRGGTANLDLKAVGGVIELTRTPADVLGFLFLGTLENANLGRSLTGGIDSNADGQPDVYIGGTDRVLFVSGNGPKTVTGNSSVSQEGGVDVTRRQLGPGVLLAELGSVLYTPGLDGSPGPLVVGPGGDVNDDGVDDLVIGAPGADPPGPGGLKTDAGKAYIVYGSPVQGPSPILLSDIGASVPGLAIEGREEGDELGHAVGGGFDVNGDMIDDALVGAPFADPLEEPEDARGEGYVVSPVAPDEVELLRLAKIGSTARLEWTPPHRALGYNVYRGLLSAVRTAGEVRTSDVVPAFECGLDQDGTVAGLPPDASDAATPPPGAAFVYLVTARNRIGEGPLGPPGDPRINDEQCP